MRTAEHESKLPALQLIDSLLVAFALWFAHLVRSWVLPEVPFPGDFPGIPSSIPPFSAFIPLLLVLLPATPLVLEFNGFYRIAWRPKPGTVIRSTLLLLLIMGFVVTLLKLHSSRMVLLMTAFFAADFLILRDAWTHRLNLRRARDPARREHLLLAAPAGRLSGLRDLVLGHPEGAAARIFELDLSESGESELLQLLHKESISRVLISAGDLPFSRIANTIKTCEIEGIEVCLLADFYRPSIARASLDDLLGHPVMVIRSAPDNSWQLLFKNLLDRVVAPLLLVLSSPLLLIAAIGIRLASPGPILFRQQRAGLHGRPFTMFKFRTMTTNAEMLQSELENFNKMSGPVFKLQQDPRVFAFGRFLRNFSLDELPQLWNVARGDMSLVGPRPLPLYEVDKISDPAQRRRLSMKPGITCIWQVRGRNEITQFDDWVKMDLEYIDNWTLWLDIRLLLATFPAVLTSRGAH
jgi:exopolysaccharide biosynthesis polyprenyl glycosylphosphotransferase